MEFWLVISILSLCFVLSLEMSSGCGVDGIWFSCWTWLRLSIVLVALILVFERVSTIIVVVRSGSCHGNSRTGYYHVGNTMILLYLGILLAWY